MNYLRNWFSASLRSLLIAFSLSCLMELPSRAAEPVSVIVSSASTATAFAQIRGLLEQTKDIAISAGDNVTFLAMQRALTVLDAWKQANSDLLDKLFSNLDKQQQQFFSNLEKSIQIASESADRALEQVTQIAESFQQTVAAATFDNRPTVFRYSPGVILSKGKSVRLVVRGLNFDRVKTELEIGSSNYPPISSTKQELQFLVPRKNMIENSRHDGLISLKLFCVKKGFIGEDKFEFPLAVFVTPESLGSCSVTFVKTVVEKVTEDRQREFHHSGRHSTEDFPQRPNDGWLIDVATIRRGRVWGEGGSSISVKPNPSKHGFVVRIRVGAIRRGFPPRYSPGYQHGIFTWKEYQETSPREVRLPAETKPVSAFGDVPFDGPENMVGFFGTIQTHTGRQLEFTKTGKVGSFRVDWDSTIRRLVIRPQAVEM